MGGQICNDDALSEAKLVRFTAVIAHGGNDTPIGVYTAKSVDELVEEALWLLDVENAQPKEPDEPYYQMTRDEWFARRDALLRVLLEVKHE